MAYSPQMRRAIGAMGAALDKAGLGRQDRRFAAHGEHEPMPGAPLVLVACSGGRDSLACAAVAHIACGMRGLRCGAVVVDHRLQEGSARVARRAADDCEALGLAPVSVREVEVGSAPAGLEAAARTARYDALVDAARELQAAVVLLAHTRDDQAEGILIDLMRATGTDALAGMPAMQVVRGVCFLRPFLDLSRADTTAICEQLGLDYWDDPTNGEAWPADEPLPDGYPLRSRVRHTLLPQFSRFAGTDMACRLAQGARIARRDVEFLDSLAAQAEAQAVQYAGDGARLDARLLAGEPEAIRWRVIAHVLARCAPGSGERHVRAVEALVSSWHGQGAVELPRKHSAIRKKHVIEVCEDVTHANRRRARRD